tara:strand:+ start:3808 stop:4608 length:801 start_codon:yes stop_codon:yes gene_type:complete
MFFYSELGKNGRIGNQMFQYATLFALGKNRQIDIGIPSTATEVFKDTSRSLSITEAFPNLSAKKIDNIEAEGQYQEESFLFSPNLFLLMDNCDIHGYFQSPFYFSKFQEELREEFQFSKNIDSIAQEKIDDIRSPDSLVCALHFRRSDYLEFPNFHTNLEAEYYNHAVSIMLDKFPDIKFVAFSDDAEWLQETLPPDILPSTGENQFEDMCMMTKCDAHIIANSSFSWWAAWLSTSTNLVIAPQRWFGPEGPKDWSTIYPPGWGLL